MGGWYKAIAGRWIFASAVMAPCRMSRWNAVRQRCVLPLRTLPLQAQIPPNIPQRSLCNFCRAPSAAMGEPRGPSVSVQIHPRGIQMPLAFLLCAGAIVVASLRFAGATQLTRTRKHACMQESSRANTTTTQLEEVLSSLPISKTSPLWITVDCADRGFGDKGMEALCEALMAIRRPKIFPRLMFYRLRLTDASMPHVCFSHSPSFEPLRVCKPAHTHTSPLFGVPPIWRALACVRA